MGIHFNMETYFKIDGKLVIRPYTPTSSDDDQGYVQIVSRFLVLVWFHFLFKITTLCIKCLRHSSTSIVVTPAFNFFIAEVPFHNNENVAFCAYIVRYFAHIAFIHLYLIRIQCNAFRSNSYFYFSNSDSWS